MLALVCLCVRCHQILFHSSQLSLLTAAAEICCAIMYPLQWPHVYIPVLPRGLVQVLQAPMPFIIGLPTDRYNEVRDVSTSVIRVDLDNNSIELDAELAIPPLPHRQEVKLRKGLKKYADAFSHRDADWHRDVLSTRDLAFKFAIRPSEVRTGVYLGGVVEFDFIVVVVTRCPSLSTLNHIARIPPHQCDFCC